MNISFKPILVSYKINGDATSIEPGFSITDFTIATKNISSHASLSFQDYY